MSFTCLGIKGWHQGLGGDVFLVYSLDLSEQSVDPALALPLGIQ
jgi:hypothetical protein